MNEVAPRTFVLIDRLVRGQYGEYTASTVKSEIEKEPFSTVNIIETGVAAAGKLLFDEWRKQLPGRHLKRSVAVPNKSKADRAFPLSNAITDGIVYLDLPKEDRELLFKEFRGFPAGMNDDIVDACSYAYLYLRKNFLNAYAGEFLDMKSLL